MNKFRFLSVLKAYPLILMISFSQFSQAVGAIKMDRGGDRQANFIQDELSYLNIPAISKSLVDRSIQCALACLNSLPCFSFNLAAFPNNNGKLLCEQLPSDKFTNSDKYVASNGFHHFSILSPCSSWFCNKNGKCLPLYKQNSYVCVCKEGFMGQNCENEYHSVTVCEGHSRQIRCENGRKFRILSANYGRLDGATICPHPSIPDLNCRASSSLGKVREICQGQTACTLHSNSEFFGVGDPCPGTYKYLFVIYSCDY
ncbi:uncharacterized protein [Montipora capricornis]|uniref:uncharacterized protein n=1 Tax=Montipora capricornis TaxID=246305 RepID=UPI0035F1F36E